MVSFSWSVKYKAISPYIFYLVLGESTARFFSFCYCIGFICYTLHSFATLCGFFATLCPIPPWLRTIFWLSVFVRLKSATTRIACKIIRPTRKAWGASRNLGKGSGDETHRRVRSALFPFAFCVVDTLWHCYDRVTVCYTVGYCYLLGFIWCFVLGSVNCRLLVTGNAG